MKIAMQMTHNSGAFTLIAESIPHCNK